MSDLALFLRSGLQNIWKEKTILLFGALSLVVNILGIVPFLKIFFESSLFLSFCSSLVNFFFLSIGYTGMTYAAYCAAIGKSISLQETLQVVKKNWGKIAALYFWIAVLVVPFVGIVSIFSSRKLLQLNYGTNNIFLGCLFPLVIFSALPYFMMVEILINGSGFRKSLKAAWSVFNDHFKMLALIGILFFGIQQIASLLFGMTATLILSNFQIASLARIDYLTPTLAFKKEIFYQLAMMIAQVFWLTYGASVYIFAYVKYSAARSSAAV